MRAIWKGSITFGLVNIPVALHNASRVEELKFRLLRTPDLSPVNYRRVAQSDGKEVPWDKIVKGYEYEKDKFVVLKDEDFKRIDLEATDTIDIIDFVDIAEVNPTFFYKPYYLEPLKGGVGAYGLLRKVLAQTNRAGISKVIIRTRQHLAAVKSIGELLMLELMRFEDELVPAGAITIPAEKKPPGAKELAMAKTLVDQMTEPCGPVTLHRRLPLRPHEAHRQKNRRRRPQPARRKTRPQARDQRDRPRRRPPSKPGRRLPATSPPSPRNRRPKNAAPRPPEFPFPPWPKPPAPPRPT